MSRATPIPDHAREAVFTRQRGLCIRCGSRYTEVHHRQRRTDGGHGYENLIGLCKTCHDYCHAHPREARDNGWIVTRHLPRDQIQTVTVTTWYIGPVLLHPDGTESSAVLNHTEERT